MLFFLNRNEYASKQNEYKRCFTWIKINFKRNIAKFERNILKEQIDSINLLNIDELTRFIIVIII